MTKFFTILLVDTNCIIYDASSSLHMHLLQSSHEYLLLTTELLTQKPYKELERNRQNFGITWIVNDHSKTFLNISKLAWRKRDWWKQFAVSKIPHFFIVDLGRWVPVWGENQKI